MAEIQSGHMPHQQLLLHRGIQPSLVINHNVDIDCHQTGLEIHPENISKNFYSFSIHYCANAIIYERFLLAN